MDFTECRLQCLRQRCPLSLLHHALRQFDPGTDILDRVESGSLIIRKFLQQLQHVGSHSFNTASEVDPTELPHLFDRFYRSDRSRNFATGGYGIGLAIAKAILNTHRGKIQASTKDGKSLTIEAVFPG